MKETKQVEPPKAHQHPPKIPLNYEKKPLYADGEKTLKKLKENMPSIFQNKHTLKIRTITTTHPKKKQKK